MTIQLLFVLALVVFMLYMEHSEVVCRRHNGELMVYSKPCTTCLMSTVQKEKITKILLDLRFFPLPFCGHRWIENKKVTDRAVDDWPYIVKL